MNEETIERPRRLAGFFTGKPIVAMETGSAERAIIIARIQFEIADRDRWFVASLKNWRFLMPWRTDRSIQRDIAWLIENGWIESKETDGKRTHWNLTAKSLEFYPETFGEKSRQFVAMPKDDDNLSRHSDAAMTTKSRQDDDNLSPISNRELSGRNSLVCIARAREEIDQNVQNTEPVEWKEPDKHETPHIARHEAMFKPPDPLNEFLAKLEREFRSHDPNFPAINVRNGRRSKMQLAFEEHGTKILSAVRWLFKSPRAAVFRKTPVTIERFLDPEKLLNYIEQSERPDAYDAMPGEKSATDQAEDFIERMHRLEKKKATETKERVSK